MKILCLFEEMEEYGVGIILRTVSIAECVESGEFGTRLLGTILPDESKERSETGFLSSVSESIYNVCG